MKIQWNCHRELSHPAAGGAERMIYELGRRLVKRGHSVTVVAGREGLVNRSTREADGIEVVSLPGYVLPHFLAPVRAHGSPPPDVLIDDLAHVVPWFSRQLTSLPVIPLFRHLHARTLAGQVTPPAAGFLSRVERYYPQLYFGCRVVTESNAGVRDLLALGMPPTNVIRIPPGVDAQKFRPHQKSSTPTLIYFGGLRRYKRPTDALAVLSGLRDSGVDCRLRVVGEGPELEAVKQMAESLGLAQAVEFLGRLDDDQLSIAVGESWVSLLCSTSEGWGLTALEAAACGTPTVAYRVPGLEDSVGEGTSGHLVQDGDIPGMVEATKRALHRSVTSDSCREWALSFDWDLVTEAWLAELELAIAAHTS